MSGSLAQAEALFHKALELPRSEREVFLKEACGDPRLLEEVLALLRAAEVADVWLNDATPEFGNAIQPGEGPGRVVGRYKLIDKIGEGGFGVVYRAEQQEPIRREVALKIIKLGMDTRSVVARFEAERQALALMDHRSIAKVVDAGATETGRPYFVMELIRGVPITQFCEENRLSMSDRLKLFAQVCGAIQHAHQRGIIHRDIKPTNILVTQRDDAPRPVVIDFGVAKALNQRLTEKTLFTNFAQMIGTPAYMSPEQAEMSKLDVDGRSDIYSLGVLLYELLTGTPPFPEERLRRAGYAEIQRILREEEPEKPSTRMSKRRVTEAEWSGNGTLPAVRTPIASDLDAIVLKCLEKEPARRYETTGALSTDLRRFLENEPVSARGPGRVYRIQKFVRRQRGVLGTALLVMCALAAGFGISQATRQAAEPAMFEEIRAKLPPRRAGTPPQLLDLSRFYNLSLEGKGGSFLNSASEHAIQNGPKLLGNVLFDIRGAIRLHSPNPYYAHIRAPERVKGINVAQNCRRLHFLHFVFRSKEASRDGEIIATYVVNYADGKTAHIPVRYAEDVLTWTSYNGLNGSADPRLSLTSSNSAIVWNGINNLSLPARMSRTTWSNPRPRVKIRTIDLVSGLTQCSHVLVAITAEP